ncbi:MAG: abortive infection family protein, partial [Chitinophagales bacterium]
MEDLDIKKLRGILNYKNRHDLANLLKNSVSLLEISSTYGSRWYSRLSTFHIKYPPNAQKMIDNLSKKDKEEIFKALLSVYPILDNEPEITEILYYPNFEIDVSELVETKELERISFDYIHEQIKKCDSKIFERDLEGAITNARTLIESICLYIIESKTKQAQNYDGNLLKLYRSVASHLRMSPGDYEDDNLRQILSGVFSIINGVSGLRNTYSDSHGSAPSMINYQVDKRHAILAVNLAKTISEYL